MTEPIALDTSVSDLDAMWETIDAICEELKLDARNFLSREIVAHEVIECARSTGKLLLTSRLTALALGDTSLQRGDTPGFRR